MAEEQAQPQLALERIYVKDMSLKYQAQAYSPKSGTQSLISICLAMLKN